MYVSEGESIDLAFNFEIDMGTIGGGLPVFFGASLVLTGRGWGRHLSRALFLARSLSLSLWIKGCLMWWKEMKAWRNGGFKKACFLGFFIFENTRRFMNRFVFFNNIFIFFEWARCLISFLWPHLKKVFWYNTTSVRFCLSFYFLHVI